MGSNDSGQLGDGTKVDRSTPVQIATGVIAVAAGDAHSLFIKSDGTLWGMGYNGCGQLSNGTSVAQRTPVQIATSVIAVAAGSCHSLFVKSDGTLWAMGDNRCGQLGDGTTTERNAPVRVATGVIAVAAGSSQSLFVKSDGSLLGMGANYSGCLGVGSSKNLKTPVQVTTGVIAVSVGAAHSLFVKNNGSLWGMGDSSSGGLGDRATTSQNTPTQITTGVTAVSAGGGHSLFVKNDDTPWAMGYNYYGQLGDRTTTSRKTPVCVGVPAITMQPSSQMVCAGQNATYVIKAYGIPSPTLQWQSSPNGTIWTNLSNTSSCTGVTTATLDITGVTAPMNGMRYRCVATNLTGSATSTAATLYVKPAPALADKLQLKIELEATGTATVTVTGTVDLALVGGATLDSAKTIIGADATSTIIGGLAITADASNTVILGVSFTSGALVIMGANDVTITNCTFTDTPVAITDGADNIAFAWNKFIATAAGRAGGTSGGSAMSIDNAGPAIGILLQNNLWDSTLCSDMPAVTDARVLMFNNYITATGNDTATIAGAGAQILSQNNIYQGTHNPLVSQDGGLLCAFGNFLTETTGTIALGNDKVFVPAYSYTMLPADIITTGTTTLADLITTCAGNTDGQNSVTPTKPANATFRINASVSGSGYSFSYSGVSGSIFNPGATTPVVISTNVSIGRTFTLTANATGSTSNLAVWQWYHDNFPIAGATASTYTVTNVTAADAGAYSVTLTTSDNEIVTSGAFTVTVSGSLQTGSGGNGNNGGGSGGGGAPSLWYAGALACFALMRLLKHNRQRA